jgi:hypothetical protein
MRRLLLALVLLLPALPATATETETLTIEPTQPRWRIEPVPISFGGLLPLETSARIGCPGFVAGAAPTVVVEHVPQVRMPFGFLEFRVTSLEAGIEATVAVQMPNGTLICGVAGDSMLRAGTFPGIYRVWVAARTPVPVPVYGTIEILHVPLQQRR